MVDDYNADVKEANVAARAAAQRAASKAKGSSAKNSKASPVVLKARGSFKTSFDKVINAAVIEVPASAIPGLLRNPRVLSIEADAAVFVEPTTVTQLDATWGIDRIDQRSLPLSGTFSSPSNASNVAVYVIDTGIDPSHPEFGGRVGSGFDAVNGGDGRLDCNGHGTHVAGTVASATYGIAKAAALVPVRVLGCDGSGTYSGVIAGLDWIAKNRPVEQRAVANMSLGGGVSSSLDSAVATLVASGVAVVVAAGNSNTDACTTSPARAAAAITVGSTTSADARSSFSNFGSCLDLFAPGSNITSTVPGGGTAIYSGTSMASPHVAGIAAVVLAQAAMTPTQLVTYLTDNATAGVVGSPGTGSPNLLAFLPGSTTPTDPTKPDTPPTVPGQPSAPVAESRNKAAVVTWTLPDDGGSPIVTQTIRAYSGGRVVAQVRVDGVTVSTRISRLRNGVAYTFTVQATNAVGAGPESAQSNVIQPTR
jgi:subtilisin family serine protease